MNERQGPRIAVSGLRTLVYSKRVIVLFIAGMAAIIFTITATGQFDRKSDAALEKERSYRAPQLADFAELAASVRRERREKPVTAPVPAAPAEKPARPIVIEAPGRERSVLPSLPRYYSDKNDAQAAAALRALKLEALTASPVAGGFEGKAGAGELEEMRNAQANERTPSLMARDAFAALAGQGGSEGQESDPNGQARKRAFLRDPSGGAAFPQGYSEHLPIPRQFPYELKAGTLIPCVMLTGIDSDLPGDVTAQVSENVWDSTGRFILIPKGTRALGVYDSQVTFGQRRVLLVWSRLILPDGSSLNVAGSAGVDQAGYAGLSGRVDEHWGEMVKSALLSSIFVAGAEVVYDGDSGGVGDENKSARDVAAESAAGSILDMGTKLMNRASDVQPTIRVRPGKRAGIFVRQDIVFPRPYF